MNTMPATNARHAVASPPTAPRRLEFALATFFVLVWLSAAIVCAVQPQIYTQSFTSLPITSDQYPAATAVFLLAIATFITVLIVGVLRHWRWVFWLILIAFSASILDVPISLLQIAGVLPLEYPVWYTLFRTGVALVEVALALWMIQILRRAGVWGMRRRTAA